jgi:S1-C subfamily serine protease
VRSREEHSQTETLIAQQTERLEEINRGLAADLEARLAARDQRLEQEVRTWTETRAAWEGQRTQLEARREELAQNIVRLEREGSASTVELASLRERLEDTTHSLERLDPVNLEQARLAQVRAVRGAVVLIETTLMFRDPATGGLVYVGNDEFGRRRLNSEQDGELLQRNSTGSGFCVREDGLILTNAHVVHPPDFAGMMFEDTESFETVVELQVVFTESDQRHAAELVGIANDGDEDVALIRITPFEGMPVLSNFDYRTGPPEPGGEVYLFGFPLGTYAVQEGDRVIASTLKGILSRRVGPYIQVDAGVHPGLSGGPATDASGHVIGIVTSVQATPMGDIVAVIGYVLPIAGVEKVWPKD